MIATGGRTGQGHYPSRSEALFSAVCQLVRLNVAEDSIKSIITNPEFRISASVLEKKRPEAYAQRQINRAHEVVSSGWDRLDRYNRPVPSLKNAQIAIHRLEISCSYDRFRNRLFVEGQLLNGSGGELSENVCAMVRQIILDTFGVDMRKDNVFDAIQAIALLNAFDPLLDYIDSLQWDGEFRLGDFLVKYFGADNTPFNRSIGKKILIAAIRRARYPGTKFDTVPVLEGEQGTGKSTAIRILAGDENFTDQETLSLDAKGQLEALEGVWICEISELAGVKKAELDKLKAFLARTEDRARPAYGRHRESRPRRSVFIGTTNDKSYLRDPTGNRRFWPIRTRRIDLQGLRADRDQLWAEATILEKRGETIELEPELWKEAADLQAKRLEPDPWLDILETAEGTSEGNEERIETSLLGSKLFLDVPPRDRNDFYSKRLANVMRSLGWEGPEPKRIHGRPQRCFFRKLKNPKLL